MDSSGSKIGFTGTRKGLMALQQNSLEQVLLSFPRIVELHHGDCIGADSVFHDVCLHMFPEVRIIIHPPIEKSARAFRDGPTTSILTPFPYLYRNRRIVEDSDLLIACPKSRKELVRSGTWATVRYARKYHKPIIFVYPDGLVDYERRQIMEENKRLLSMVIGLGHDLAGINLDSADIDAKLLYARDRVGAVMEDVWDYLEVLKDNTVYFEDDAVYVDAEEENGIREAFDCFGHG